MNRKVLVSVGLLIVLLLTTVVGTAASSAEQRPIEDFVSAQGTFCIDDGQGGCFLIVPPIANFIGWTDPAEVISASVDYAGLADDWAGGAFGTQMTGSVTERPLADGRAEVHVRLHTSNALSWAVDGFDFNGPLLFGNRAPDVLSGMEAALGDSLLHVKFINTAPGDPLPDLIQLVFFPQPGQELLFLSFQASAFGPRSDGTPGGLKVIQTGLFLNTSEAAFPVEKINLFSVGR